MSDLTFSVIDTSCESADQTFFPPRIVLSTKSTTQIATVLGFDEYIPSTPPKRYKTLSWDGSSENQLWFVANTPGNAGPAYQIGGAKFDYSGQSIIDLNGNYVDLYEKNLSQMCDGLVGGLYATLIPIPTGGLQHYQLIGWIGPTGHTKCTPPGTPYTSFGDQAIGKGVIAPKDSSILWGSHKPNPNQSNVQVSDFVIVDSTHAECVDENTDPNNTVLICLFEPLPLDVDTTIDSGNQGTVWFFAYMLWDHNYFAVLSDEYTDAEALSNAQVVIGNGATAQNLPRTTGFVSRFTNVVYTLTIANLIVGSDYLVSVDFWDPVTGVTTTNQIGFLADQTTHSVIGIVPTPASGHSTVVRNPRIAFTT